MSGGKGGGQSTKTEIPVWAEEATKRNLARAEDVQRIGYMPYYGPDVAAFNPTQQLAMQNNMDAAAAFGSSPLSLFPRSSFAAYRLPYSSVCEYQGVGFGRECFPAHRTTSAGHSCRLCYKNAAGRRGR